MAVPGATPLNDLIAAYAGVCAAIRDALTDPKVSYTVPGGASLNWDQYYAGLVEREKALREIPGVAPDTHPHFEVLG